LLWIFFSCVTTIIALWHIRYCLLLFCLIILIIYENGKENEPEFPGHRLIPYIEPRLLVSIFLPLTRTNGQQENRRQNELVKGWWWCRRVHRSPVKITNYCTSIVIVRFSARVSRDALRQRVVRGDGRLYICYTMFSGGLKYIQIYTHSNTYNTCAFSDTTRSSGR
jgi:hypothetical protein